MLVHSKMSKRTAPYHVTKCNRRRCTQCSTIKESDCFMSTNTASVHKMNYDLSCTLTAEIYLITCKKCKAQYVGQTRQKCANRMNNHKYDIVHFPHSQMFMAISILLDTLFKIFLLCQLIRLQMTENGF